MFFDASNSFGPIGIDGRGVVSFLLNAQGAMSIAVGLCFLALAVVCVIVSRDASKSGPGA